MTSLDLSLSIDLPVSVSVSNQHTTRVSSIWDRIEGGGRRREGRGEKEKMEGVAVEVEVVVVVVVMGGEREARKSQNSEMLVLLSGV